MKVTVIGAGYVGFSLAVLFAQMHDVVVVEKNEEKVNRINDKQSVLKERGIKDAVEKFDLSITATTSLEEGVKDSKLILVCVPTNYDEERNEFDVSILNEVLMKISEINKKAAIVIKSTIPIGYTMKAAEMFNNKKIVFSPEFMREGRALYDVVHPSRIVVGAEDNDESVSSRDLYLKTYSFLVANKPTILSMSTKEAESVKLFSNTYLAMRVAFFNELDAFAEENDLDTQNIIDGVCADSRIGKEYAKPSFGYGGYCLPKDTLQLASQMEKVDGCLIQSISLSNDERIKSIANKAIKNANGRVIGIYGIAMKPNSDNSRMSASLKIARMIKDMNYPLIIYDDNVVDLKNSDLPFAKTEDEFLKKAEYILTDYNYKSIKNKTNAFIYSRS